MSDSANDDGVESLNLKVEGFDEEQLEVLRSLPLGEIPEFLKLVEDELGISLLFVLSSDHPPGTFTLVEVDEDEMTEDGRLPVPTTYENDIDDE
ncbi:MAG: hypothetical protein ABEN55_06240 [Bradymonadaceae bacterium]